MFPNCWVTEGKEADLLHTTPPLPALHPGSPSGQVARGAQEALTLALCTFPGGAGKERELPFLELSSVPSLLLATFHPLPRGILPVTLQCPDDTGSQMRKQRLRVVP